MPLLTLTMPVLLASLGPEITRSGAAFHLRWATMSSPYRQAITGEPLTSCTSASSPAWPTPGAPAGRPRSTAPRSLPLSGGTARRKLMAPPVPDWLSAGADSATLWPAATRRCLRARALAALRPSSLHIRMFSARAGPGADNASSASSVAKAEQAARTDDRVGVSAVSSVGGAPALCAPAQIGGCPCTAAYFS